MKCVFLTRRKSALVLILCAGITLLIAVKQFQSVNSHLKPTADLQGDSSTWTKNKYVNRSGFVFGLLVYEQMAEAASNVMNLQCWAASVGLEVVEPSIRDTAGAGDQVFHFSPDYQNMKRFRDLFDIEQWSRYSDVRHYAPLRSMETFLEKAPRNVIFVEVMYSTSLCPKEALRRVYPFSFLRSHGFKVVRSVCINLLQDGRLRTQREFNDLVFGDLSGCGSLTVVFDEWRAIRNESEREGKLDFVKPGWEWHRILIKDSICHYFCTDHGVYKVTQITPDAKKTREIDTSALRTQAGLSLVPSAQILDHTEKYRTQYMNSKLYIAIMMRMELLQSGLESEEGYTKCVNVAENLWKYATKTYGVNQTYLTSDMGKYGSYSWTPPDNCIQFEQDILKAVGLPPSYPETRDKNLESITQLTGRVEMSWTQGIIAAQARCIIIVGAGSAYHNLLLNIHNILYGGTECYVFVSTTCDIKDQWGFQ